MLWNSLLIDFMGDVYFCCHRTTRPVGNIKSKSLREIWQGPWMQELREGEALPCLEGCDQQQYYTIPVKIPDYPNHLDIVYNNICNLSCIMCHEHKEERFELSNKLLYKQIDFSQIDCINLMGGELLISDNAKDFISSLITFNSAVKIFLVTNGTNLDASWRTLLVKFDCRIQISLNAASAKTHEEINVGSKFERVVANIKELVSLKKKTNSRIHICYKFTIVPENIGEIAQAIMLAVEIGCDEIIYGYDTSVINFLSENEPIREELKRDLDLQIDKYQEKIVIEKLHLEQLKLLLQ